MHQVAAPHWRDAPQVPSLGTGQLDVWRIRLDPADDAALTNPRTQAAAAMRQILAHYLARPSAALEIDRLAGGKPYLAGNDRTLEFNLSHTQGMALLAVSAHRPVGVDIEAIRSLADPLRLARRVMDEASIDALQATTDTEQRLQLFLDLWTQLEARQKTHGLGIFAPAVSRESTQSFGFRLDDAWQACVAVAASPEPVELRFFRFEAS